MSNSSNGSSGEPESVPAQGYFRGINRYLRTEAVALFFIVLIFVGAYVYFFIDNHARWVIEDQLTRSSGAQVDIRNAEISFLEPSLTLHEIQMTNPDKPTHNLFELGKLYVSVNWPPLLESKYHFKDIRVETLKYDTKRSRPGRVLDEGGAIRQMTDFVETQFQQKTQGTILETVLALIEGTKLEEQLDTMKGNLKSFDQARKIQSDVEKLRSEWSKRLEKLPNKETLEQYRKELESLLDSKSDPLSTVARLKKIKSIVSELKKIRKRIQDAQQSFSSDRSQVRGRIEELQASIQNDRESLRKRFQVPSFDMKELSQDIFSHFLDHQTESLKGTLRHVRDYVPDKNRIEGQPQGPQRSRGANYRFRSDDSEPVWWVKSANLTATVTEAGGGGSVEVDLSSLSSNPAALDEPTKFKLDANLPGAPVRTIRANLAMNRRTEEPRDQFAVDLSGWSIAKWTLMRSSRYRLSLEKAVGSLDVDGTLEGNRLEATLDVKLHQPVFDYDAEIPWVREVLGTAVNGLSTVSLNASTRGPLESLHWTARSNLGDALGDALTFQVSNRIEDARNKVVSQFNSRVQQQTNQLDGQVGGVQSLVESRLGPIHSQLNEVMNLASKRSETVEGNLEEKSSGPADKKKKKLLDSLNDKLEF